MYAYVLVFLLIEVCQFAGSRLLDVNSIAYSQLYAWSNVAVNLLAIAVVLRIYRLAGNWSVYDLHLVVAALGTMGHEFLRSPNFWISYWLLNSAHLFLGYLGIVTMIRLQLSRKILLGWNLWLVLIAIMLPGAFQAVVLAGYLLDPQVYTYTLTTYGMKLAAIASWIILAVGLSEYSPPRRINLPKIDGDLAVAQIRNNIRGLWETR